MPPPEYAQIDTLILNATGYPGWCDFDVSTIPVWGSRVMKGAPSVSIPHAHGDLAMPVHRAGISFSMIGTVYGDRTLAGAHVTGLAACRLQLADNLAALMALMDGTTKAFSYILGARTYSGDVTVIDMQSRSAADDAPTQQKVTLKLHLASGLLVAA